jgi:type IV pilus assembly protein PilM
MASAPGVVWAIDVGNNLLRALRLRVADGGTAEVVGFDAVEHTKFLGAPDVKPEERQEVIAASIRQFIDRNNIQKTSGLVVAVPGSKSFAKFIKLPPVEPKRIPEMIRYEAVQQIPSDINEVEWDWQIMAKKDSPDTEVGIFFVKNEVLDEVLSGFTRENMKINLVQMAPMALYNYVVHDLTMNENQGVIVLDMGSESTDLVVCTPGGVWQRSVPIGGNAFTKAIASAFKLDFNKAEKLKRTAPVSKYAKQIFQAMRPVFSDLAAEIQRSLGFYSSSHKRVNFIRVVALGGGMRLPGVTKFLQQTLQMPIVKPDSFERLSVAADISAAKFHENVADFGVVYGLGLQGLGLAKIQTNLLPRSIARSMQWASKAKVFTAAAAVLVLVSILAFARTTLDRGSYAGNKKIRDATQQTIAAVQQAITQYGDQNTRGGDYDLKMQKQVEIFKYRDIIPRLNQTIIDCLPNEKNNPGSAALYKAFRNGDVATMMLTPRKQRPLVFITGVSIVYSSNLTTAAFREISTGMTMGTGIGGAGEEGGVVASTEGTVNTGFAVVIEGYSPYEDIRNLLEPAGAANDMSKWGLVTRLKRLKEFLPQCGLESFRPMEATHFSLAINPVVLTGTTPVKGIGVMKLPDPTKPGSSLTPELIDPMTKETINAVAKRDGTGFETINDSAFTIHVKFLWKDAPAQVAVTQSTGTSVAE